MHSTQYKRLLIIHYVQPMKTNNLPQMNDLIVAFFKLCPSMFYIGRKPALENYKGITTQFMIKFQLQE